MTLAVCYALMSFITAHSELIMWLDAMIYLPLVILGIDRLVKRKTSRVIYQLSAVIFIQFLHGLYDRSLFRNVFLGSVGAQLEASSGAIIPYGITSLLAGGASMVIILPALLDLRSNGEELTTISSFKTEATDVFDLVMKNMIGVYDTTKYGSIPFIYIGLLPLLLCILYFVSKKIRLKDKFLYAGMFAVLIASFISCR